ANTQVYIVNKYNGIQPQGLMGELLIGGHGVARGYLNNPEYTAEKFTVNPYVAGGRLYKTGDIARWLTHREIDFLGRVDQQVKVRGYRIELEEIEEQLKKHPAVKEAVVLVREVQTGDKYLCAYIAASIEVGAGELREYLAHTLPDYMLPSYFVEIGTIPLTPNGKIDRGALPEPGLKAGKEYTAPGNTVEERLVKIWSCVLGIDEDIISIQRNFFELGGDSLRATVMAGKINEVFHVKLPLTEVFKTPTIRGLAKYVRGTPGNRYTAIESVEKKEYYTASSAQKRLYVLQQVEPRSTTYNMSQVIPVMIEDETGIEKIEQTFTRLINRHDSLR
ncbi:MAG: AMP-binding protein, partial [bacterium]|nr:AMP-binding protein [bacterium]